MEYLEFEKPIEELMIKLKKAEDLAKDKEIDVSKTINDIKEQLKMEVISISTIKQDPGNIIPMHKDIFKKIKDEYDITGKKIVRANIHLDEWNPGQVIQYQKNGEWKSHTHWKVNDGLMFDDSCLHIGMNGGLKPKYTMQISGFYNGKVI